VGDIDGERDVECECVVDVVDVDVGQDVAVVVADVVDDDVWQEVIVEDDDVVGVGHDDSEPVTVIDLDIVGDAEDVVDVLCVEAPLLVDEADIVEVELPVEDDVPQALTVEVRDIMLLTEAMAVAEAPHRFPFTVSQNKDVQSSLTKQASPLSAASRRIDVNPEPAVSPTAWRLGIMYIVSNNINFILIGGAKQKKDYSR
jgi:hypothetical protein